MRNVGKGKTAASVVLVGLDNEDMGLVREVLAAEAVLPNSSVTHGNAIEQVKRSRPDVVIIGFNQSKDGALALGQALTKEAPNIVLVAMSRKSDANDILAAMRVGYKEFVVLPDDANRLRQAVKGAAYATAESDEEKGQVIAFVGAKGGVGTTMIVTNLATELAAIHRVMVMDLDFGVGDVASMLDIQAKDSIVDVLPRADKLDERMLTASVAVHKSKVHVLAQPSDLQRIDDVKADDVYSLIDAAAKAYQYILLDLGSRWDEPTVLALSVADQVVMVTTPDVIGVRDAYRRLKLFEHNSIEKERLRLLVNRYHKGAYVRTEDIEQNLGIKVTGVIANDVQNVEQAINEGKSVRQVDKKSDTARDLSTLVAILADGADGGVPAPQESEEPQGFFSKFFGGRK